MMKKNNKHFLCTQCLGKKLKTHSIVKKSVLPRYKRCQICFTKGKHHGYILLKYKKAISVGVLGSTKDNYDIYNEIKNKAVITLVSNEYGRNVYNVVAKTGETLTDDEKALIADNGNLSFGYYSVGNTFVIWTD